MERQIGIVENLISRGYGAIVIAPADSKRLVRICSKALDKNIVVINIDNPLHQGTMDQLGISIPFVGSDNRTGAGMVGKYVKSKDPGPEGPALPSPLKGSQAPSIFETG